MTILSLSLRVAALLLALNSLACGDCTEEIDAARVFLEKNRSCQVDDDCVAVSTGCHTFTGGLCAQAAVNRTAAATAEWQRLSQGLKGCQSECAACDADLIPQCTAGVCGGSP